MTDGLCAMGLLATVRLDENYRIDTGSASEGVSGMSDKLRVLVETYPGEAKISVVIRI